MYTASKATHDFLCVAFEHVAVKEGVRAFRADNASEDLGIAHVHPAVRDLKHRVRHDHLTE